MKSCDNCGYKRKDCLGIEECNLSGLYCNVERQFNTKCDKNFSGWVAIPPSRSFKEWFLDTFWK